MNAIRDQIEREGRVWLRGAVSPAELGALEALSSDSDRPGERIAERTPLFRAVSELAFAARLRASWPGLQPVRLVAFDKGSAANWGLPWHQDRVIVVRARTETPGVTNWSRKAGTWHCEPPVEVLERMLFVRVHLDASTAENGAMEIAPGSHRAGKVSSERAAEVAARDQTELTLAEPGDVLVLAMLTLHRSLPSVSAEGRRVLRIDYAAGDPPSPLAWTC